MNNLRWTKLNTKGEQTSREQNEPGKKGVWIATKDVPYTDQQGTLFWWSWDGTVMTPVLCMNGHDRRVAYDEAANAARR